MATVQQKADSIGKMTELIGQKAEKLGHQTEMISK